MRLQPWQRFRERSDERGAVTLLAALMIVVLMVSGAFAVDLGMTRVARADVQALADVVALDLARNIDGRTAQELEPVLDAALAASVARNKTVLGDGDPDVRYELGTMTGGRFAPVTSATAVPSTVEVEAHASVSYGFARVFSSEEHGDATQTADAQSSSTACFKLGTFVAAVRSGDSTVLAPLDDLFGVNLDLVSYQGLANADLRLEQLAAVASIGSPEHLLTSTITYADLLQAMAEALTRENNGSNTVALQALDKLISSSTTASVGLIRLGDVLHVSPTDVAALQAELNVLDIIGTARLADGDYFLGVPNIQGQVPGVGFQFSGGIYLVAAARMACGAPNTVDAKAKTAQLDGSVHIDFTNLPSLNVAGLGTLQTPKGDGSITVVGGGGEGQLIAPPAVHCGANTVADPTTFSVRVATQLAAYKMAANVTIAADVKVSDLLGQVGLGALTNLLGALLPLKATLEVKVALNVGTQSSPPATTVGLKIPPNDQTPVSTGGSMYLDPSSVVPAVTSITINGKVLALADGANIVNLVVQALLDPSKGFIDKSLTPLINNINQEFIGPVARMIGLRLAGADVYAVKARCGAPRLVG
ncbi:hypothetical protein [Nocardioides daeguensis]|uniref:TadG family pilus assembly protein n=1 Tax=Nocardioides daeguensis TaxID=908359 RepID=A0ABP6VK70_9ACTN|nr:hypothetical protein [Nocardioides daeguensis]MBV6727344.1 hypothetical protein [Nocardioides daeguensis]MCR1775433.1 hypothetical protein [Nocardioides daeguensis]